MEIARYKLRAMSDDLAFSGKKRKADDTPDGVDSFMEDQRDSSFSHARRSASRWAASTPYDIGEKMRTILLSRPAHSLVPLCAWDRTFAPHALYSRIGRSLLARPICPGLWLYMGLGCDFDYAGLCVQAFQRVRHAHLRIEDMLFVMGGDSGTGATSQTTVQIHTNPV
jgi:hypothetical protein